jgi:hypothetical protein
LEESADFLPIINHMKSQTAIDASSFSKDLPLVKLNFKGINSLYCFMLEEESNDLIGYADSWVLDNSVNLSHPSAQTHSKQQLLLEAKLRAGKKVKRCSNILCQKLYVKSHNCKFESENKNKERLLNLNENDDSVLRKEPNYEEKIARTSQKKRKKSDIIIGKEIVKGSNSSNHEWIGRHVKIWFSDKKKYYFGTIKSFEGGKSFKIQWGNHVKENIELDAVHCNNEESDNDRWNFLD